MEKYTTVASDFYKKFSDFKSASLIPGYKVYFSGSSSCNMDRDNSDDSGIEDIEPSTPPQPSANTTEPNIPPQPTGNTTEPSLPPQPTANTRESTSSNAATGPGQNAQNTGQASKPQVDSQYGLETTE